MRQQPQEHQPAPQSTRQGAVELDESQLDQAHGGAGFIKFDGIEGDVGPTRAQRAETPTIRQK